MKILRNNRGVTLAGTMVAAGIGLVVTLGISKALVNFTEQTQKTSRKQAVTSVKSNLESMLRMKNKLWDESLQKAKDAGCGYPGEIPSKCPMDLYLKSSIPNADPHQVTCLRPNGNLVGFYSTTGTIKYLTTDICKKCKKDANCGLDANSNVRFVINKPEVDKTAVNVPPQFSGVIEDSGGSKHTAKFSVSSDGEGVILHPDTFTVTNTTNTTNQVVEHIVGVNKDGTPKTAPTFDKIGCAQGQYLKGIFPDGKPDCRRLFNNITCPNGKYLVGMLHNGNPDCRTLPAPPSAPKVTLDNNCGGSQYIYKIANNRAYCRTDQKGSTTVISSGGGGGGSSCSGSGTKPRGSYLHTSGGSGWVGCANMGLACGKSNGNSAKCCSGTAQWVYTSGCDVAPQCQCN